VTPPLTEVPVQCPRRLYSERDGAVPRSRPARCLAFDEHHSVTEFNIGDLEAGQLGQPEPAVQQDHQDRCVAATDEAVSIARREQSAEVIEIEDRCLRVARCRGLDPRCGVAVGLAFSLEPTIEVPYASKSPPGRCGGPGLADVYQPAAHVVALQLKGPDLGVMVPEPVGKAPDRAPIGQEGVSAYPSARSARSQETVNTSKSGCAMGIF
jgi:hypothetical protein